MPQALSRIRADSLARPQFRLDDLLLLTVAAAIAVAAIVNGWEYGLTIGVVGAICLGLLVEGWDIWRGFRNDYDLNADERHGWRFAVAWRLGALPTFVSLVVLEWVSPPLDRDLWNGAERAIVYYLVAIVGLSSVPRDVSRRIINGRWRWLLRCGLAVFVASIALHVWKSAAHLLFVQHRGVMGYVQSIPGLGRNEWSTPVMAIEGERFLAVSIEGLLSALAAVALLAGLAQQWCRPRWRLALAVAVLMAVAGSIGIAAWLSTVGLASASPFFVELPVLYSWQVNCIAATMLAIVATVAAYRLVQPLESRVCSKRHWRQHAAVYFHHWRMVAALLAVAAIAQVITAYGKYDWFKHFYSTGILVAESYEGVMTVAVVVVAARCLFRGWRGSVQPSDDGLRTLQLSRFLFIWLSMLVILPTAALTCRWLAFGLWLSR